MDKLWKESGMYGESFFESDTKGLPRGGCKLLFEVLQTCTTCDDPQIILGTRRSQEEWLAYFKADKGSAFVNMTEEALTDMSQDDFDEYAGKGALAEMTWNQASTLVAYLSINLPAVDDKAPKGGCRLLQDVLAACGDCDRGKEL
jgi:hypothetical protein